MNKLYTAIGSVALVSGCVDPFLLVGGANVLVSSYDAYNRADIDYSTKVVFDEEFSKAVAKEIKALEEEKEDGFKYTEED